VILDHVLVRGLPESIATSAQRVLDAGVVVEVAGQSVATAHSDHYGVRATLDLSAAGDGSQTPR
jgi:hypothetical protein